MNKVHIFNLLKSKFFDFYFLKNFQSLFLIITFSFFWLTIGQYIDLTTPNFFSAGHLIIFFTLLILILYEFFLNKKISFFILLIIYPISASIGSLLNPDNLQNEKDLTHFFLTISNLVLFFSLLDISDLRKKNTLLCFYISLGAIFMFFFFFLLPDFFNRIENNIHPRYLYLNQINFLNFKLNYLQNSNGAARIIFIVLLYCFAQLYIIKRSNQKLLLHLSIFILSIILFYYQSRLVSIFYAMFLIIFYIFQKNLNIYKKILFLICFLIIPFLINNYYNNFLNYNKINLYNQKPYSLNENLSSLNENLLSFNKNRFFPKNEISSSIFEIESCKDIFQNRYLNILDNYSSGRICGWKILIDNLNKKDIFFGKGFFNDQKILKKYQKLSSNSYLNILFNAGIFGIFSILLFKIKYLIHLKNNYNLQLKLNFENLLSIFLIFFLIFRSLFEDIFAFKSIDLILFLNCLTVILFKKTKKFK